MDKRSWRALALVLAATLPTTVLADEHEAGTEAQPCPEFAHLEGVGNVCPRGEGLYEVFSPDGASLGFTHGADPIPSGSFASATASDPRCVAASTGATYTRVVYARALDDADGYAAWAPQLRDLVRTANGYVDDAARATSDAARLRVLCAGGDISVASAILPTRMANADFSTIVTDLRNLGYNDPLVKYWVFYDDTGVVDRCQCSGTGHRYDDDRLIATNSNNGHGVPMFAVTFGGYWPETWLHELSHTMGAVHSAAPYGTGAGHCYDGRDIMCYNDGGPRGHWYSDGYCSTVVFDCDKDTYFHAHPASGSYLATHWNLGSRLNRYIDFARPVVDLLSCPAQTSLHETMTCTIRANDDSTGVRFEVRWGDGTLTRAPASGYLTPGVTYSVSHAYTSGGTRTVSATAVDSDGWATFGTVTDVVDVRTDVAAPTVSIQEPRAGHVYNACDFVRPGVPGNIVFLREGCMKFTASDPSGLRHAELAMWHRGDRIVLWEANLPHLPKSIDIERPIRSPTSGPAVLAFQVPIPRGELPLELLVTDGAGNTHATYLRFTQVG